MGEKREKRERRNNRQMQVGCQSPEKQDKGGDSTQDGREERGGGEIGEEKREENLGFAASLQKIRAKNDKSNISFGSWCNVYSKGFFSSHFSQGRGGKIWWKQANLDAKKKCGRKLGSPYPHLGANLACYQFPTFRCVSQYRAEKTGGSLHYSAFDFTAS